MTATVAIVKKYRLFIVISAATLALDRGVTQCYRPLTFLPLRDATRSASPIGRSTIKGDGDMKVVFVLIATILSVTAAQAQQAITAGGSTLPSYIAGPSW